MTDRILISFGRPRMGELLLRLAHLLRPRAELQAIHFTPDPTISREEAAYNTAESFDRLKTVADELQTRIRYVYRETSSITEAIVRHTETFNPHYLFLGAAGPFASEEPLGGRIAEVLSRVQCHAGIILDRGLERFDQFLIVRDAKHGSRISELFEEAPGRARIEIVDRLSDGSLIGLDSAVAVVPSERLQEVPESGSAMILHFHCEA